jgi:hypothetical protein
VTHGARISHHLSALLYREVGDHADRRLSVLLCLHGLRYEATAKGGRLLRVLLLWLDTVPAHAGAAFDRGAARSFAVLIADLAADFPTAAHSASKAQDMPSQSRTDVGLTSNDAMKLWLAEQSWKCTK